MTDLQPGQVNIRGKIYETVALRVKKFWEQHPEWSIQTILISADDNRVVMKATVLDESSHIVGCGHAEEYRDRGQINRTSALENCETSAIGRALACIGLGGMEFRSAEEMQNAVLQQEEMDVELKRRVIAAMLECLEENDSLGIRQTWDELDKDQQSIVWREFNTHQKGQIREALQEGARILAEQSTGDQNASSENVEND